MGKDGVPEKSLWNMFLSMSMGASLNKWLCSQGMDCYTVIKLLVKIFINMKECQYLVKRWSYKNAVHSKKTYIQVLSKTSTGLIQCSIKMSILLKLIYKFRAGTPSKEGFHGRNSKMHMGEWKTPNRDNFKEEEEGRRICSTGQTRPRK